MICKKCGNEKTRRYRKDRKCYDWTCRYCQKEWYQKNKEYVSKRMKGYYSDNKDLNKQKAIRERRWFSGNREKCLERDGHKCSTCGSKKILCVHHIDSNGRGKENPNNSMCNLITLCSSCHAKIHSTKKFIWDEKMRNNYKEISHLSNRSIAKLLHITHPTVAKMRKIFT